MQGQDREQGNRRAADLGTELAGGLADKQQQEVALPQKRGPGQESLLERGGTSAPPSSSRSVARGWERYPGTSGWSIGPLIPPADTRHGPGETDLPFGSSTTGEPRRLLRQSGGDVGA